LPVVLGGLLLGVLGAVYWPAPGPRYAGEPVGYWLALSLSEDHRERLRAEATLGEMGAEALPELARALRARESKLTPWRQRIRKWLVPTASQPPSAEAMVAAAARQVGRLGPAGVAVAPALREAAGSGPDSGLAAAAVLVRLGEPAVPDLLRALREDPLPVRSRVVAALEGVEPSGWQDAAVTALVDGLLDLLETDRGLERGRFLTVLARLGAEDPRVPSALADWVAGGNSEERLAAARGLAALGPPAREATNALTGMLAAASAVERHAAAVAWWSLTREAGPVMPVLIGLVRDPEVGWRTAHLLGQIGSAATPAVPVLLELLATEATHRPSRTPSMTAVALGRIGMAAPEVVMPGIVRLLEHSRADVRLNAAATVQTLGPGAAPALPALVAMLGAGDPEERMTAANALAALGPEAQAAEGALAELARETSGDVLVGHVASSAREALRRIRNVPAAP
jgi:HEAT repeat protein